MEIILTESPHLSYLVYLLAQLCHGTITGTVYLLRKAAKQMYCINYLIRAGVPTSDIVCVSIIRPVLEYACPVWHPGLTKKLSKDTECAQKQCSKLLFPALSYTESLSKSGLKYLDNHRDMITQSMFRQINNPKHPLNYLLPPVKVSHNETVLRSGQNFKLWKGLCTILHFHKF